MMRHAGHYALLQYSPVPERQEFLNFGVLLLVPEIGFADVAIASGSARMEKIFQGIHRPQFEDEKRGFGNRLLLEFRRKGSPSSIDELSGRLANNFRVSKLRPVAVEDADRELKRLFDRLVGNENAKRRERRIASKLRDAFIKYRIVQFLEHPLDIKIPEAGVTISAPFGYQNGAYNLIDGVRISGNPAEDMKETGRRAIEGGLLWKHFENLSDKRRLVVVGDFSKHDHKFYDAVGDLLEENNVRLYRLDNLDPLVEDIKLNATLHS